MSCHEYAPLASEFKYVLDINTCHNTSPHSLHYAAMASILDSPIQTGEPVHELSSIFPQISLYDYTLPVAHQPPPPPCSPVKFKQRPGPRKQPISAAPCWIPPPAATPTRAKRSRTVEFKLGVLSWAHYAQVDDGRGRTRKPTIKEVQQRFGLKNMNQVSKWRKVQQYSSSS